MPSFTSWHRLEPRSRDGDMREGVQARIYDPAWLLAQQWRLGEFEGRDVASPVRVELKGQRSRLTRFLPRHPGPQGTAAGIAYDSNQVPLEALAEREPVPRGEGRNLRLAAEAGLELGRLMRDEGVDQSVIDTYLDDYALGEPSTQVDTSTHRLMSVIGGRVLDGNRLHPVFRPSPDGPVVGPPASYIPDASQRENVKAAAERWVPWYEALLEEPTGVPSPWLPERMEYQFAASARSADGEDVLVASEYAHGHLDWYAFDLASGASLGAEEDAAPEPFSFEGLPTRIAFGGMPARRWWQFEDRRLDFGRVDARATDLARMLLIEFAAVYGNDHFVIPVDLPVGSLFRTASLVVDDNFGGRTLVRSASDSPVGSERWRMFTLAVEGGEAVADFFFLPPTLGPSLEGPALEEVLFLRDEGANMAWGVERVVEGPTGRPLDRHEAHQEQRRRDERERQAAPAPESRAAPLIYRLETDVPPHWVPLVPVQVDGRSTRLRVGRMRAKGVPVPPESDLLTAKPQLDIFEEEVPRAGARVTRSYQYARWIDGSTHLWLGRRKRAGRGEGSSGLRFDVVEPSGGEAG